MPKKQRFDRQPPSRNIAPKILIVCEGSKTEPKYFKSIRQHRRLQTLQVKIIDAAGKTDPRSIVQRAIEERQQIKAENGWEKLDQAWAVFDGDEHIETDPKNWEQAIQTAAKQKINLAITNPCFEFWYLLHYQDALSQMTAATALKKLKQHVPQYDKSSPMYPDPLADRTHQAINRAQKIAAQIQRDRLHEYSNLCCSRLPELIETLLRL